MKKFKAVVDGTEYEIELELVEDDGKGSAAVTSGMMRREPKRPAQAAAPRAAAPAPAAKPAPVPKATPAAAVAPAGAGVRSKPMAEPNTQASSSRRHRSSSCAGLNCACRA